jgi:hypothetical protein
MVRFDDRSRNTLLPERLNDYFGQRQSGFDTPNSGQPRAFSSDVDRRMDQ